MWGRDYQKEQRRVDLGASDKQEQLHSRAGTGANESLAYELERITCCARIGPNEPLIRLVIHSHFHKRQQCILAQVRVEYVTQDQLLSIQR